MLLRVIDAGFGMMRFFQVLIASFSFLLDSRRKISNLILIKIGEIEETKFYLKKKVVNIHNFHRNHRCK